MFIITIFGLHLHCRWISSSSSFSRHHQNNSAVHRKMLLLLTFCAPSLLTILGMQCYYLLANTKYLHSGQLVIISNTTLDAHVESNFIIHFPLGPGILATLFGIVLFKLSPIMIRAGIVGSIIFQWRDPSELRRDQNNQRRHAVVVNASI